MNEDRLNTLRQQDKNLLDALRQEAAEMPQMPADLNARLMQRMEAERTKPRRIVWPWIVAACVAGVMMIWLTSPKTNDSPLDVVAKKAVVKKPALNNKVEDPIMAKAETEASDPVVTPIKKKKAKMPTTVAKRDAAHLGQKAPSESVKTESTAVQEPRQDLAQATPKTKTRTLTEQNIPITHPENYKYTPEELALMKKQADEAYLKWVELELEIAKHNLEQTAQNDY